MVLSDESLEHVENREGHKMQFQIWLWKL